MVERACAYAVSQRGPSRARLRGRPDRRPHRAFADGASTEADEEIGHAAAEVENKITGAEGRLAQAENRHAELLARRDRGGRSSSSNERSRSKRSSGSRASWSCPIPSDPTEVRRLQPDPEVEATAMQIVMEHERAEAARSSTSTRRISATTSPASISIPASFA